MIFVTIIVALLKSMFLCTVLWAVCWSAKGVWCTTYVIGQSGGTANFTNQFIECSRKY